MQERNVNSVHRKTEAHKLNHSSIAVAHAQAHNASETEARKQQSYARELRGQKIQSGQHVALLVAGGHTI